MTDKESRLRFKWGVPTEHVRQIASLALFAGCSPRELRRIDSLTTAVHVDAGRVLCRQGERGSQCFIVVSGCAIAAIDGEYIATIARGEPLGEMAFLAPDRRRTATAWAATDMTLLVLTPAEFRTLLSSVPSVARALMREMTRRFVQNLDVACRSSGASYPRDPRRVRDVESVLR
jgi:CRP/FNR family transcriptional regulator, cyclic AMP receptor protein